jgi:DNA polymerase-3 subunit gamma/tau
MLTREAWNTLLKVLEEPPPRVVFVFATTEPQKIAQAAAPVLSRLQRFDLKRIGTSEIRERLAHVLGAEKVEASDEALVMLARAADGSMRDALSLTDQALSLATGKLTADTVREALGLVPEEEYIALLRLIAERRAADVFPAVARLAEGGVDFGVLLAGLADTLRAQLAVSLGGTAPEMSESAAASLLALRESLPPSDVLRMLNVIADLEPRFKRSTQQRLLLETLLVRFALMDRSISLEEILRGFGESGGGPSTPGGPAGSGGSRRFPAEVRPVPKAPTATRTSPTDAAAPDSGPTASAQPQRALQASSPAGSLVAAAAAVAGAMAGVAASVVGSAASAATATAGTGSRASARPVAPGRDRPTPSAGLATAAHPADAAPLPAAGPLDLNRLVERWDDIVERVRAAGRAVLASALAEAIPTAVSRNGVITIQIDGAQEGAVEVAERALEGSAEDLLSEIRREFSDVTRVVLRRPEGGSAPGGARRLTEDALRADKIAKLRKRDPLLGKAIDVLDLELIE